MTFGMGSCNSNQKKNFNPIFLSLYTLSQVHYIYPLFQNLHQCHIVPGTSNKHKLSAFSMLFCFIFSQIHATWYEIPFARALSP